VSERTIEQETKGIVEAEEQKELNDFGHCGECAHFFRVPLKMNEGECHYGPPAVFPLMISQNQMAIKSQFPPVAFNGIGCSKFEKKSE